MRGNPLKYTDPSGRRLQNWCWWCDQALLDYSNQKGLADTAIDVAATVGCFFIGCQIDRETNQVTGPSVEEATDDAVLGIVSPVGMVNVPGAGQGLGQALRSFTQRNFRENLRRLTGKTKDEIKGIEAHHVLPKALKERFEKVGLNVHDPRFGSWVEAKPHRGWSRAYNEEWKKFLDQGPTIEEILEFGRKQGEDYGFQVNY